MLNVEFSALNIASAAKDTALLVYGLRWASRSHRVTSKDHWPREQLDFAVGWQDHVQPAHAGNTTVRVPFCRCTVQEPKTM